MLLLIRKSVFATLAALTFVVTTLTGLMAGLIGAMLRTQIPDSVLTEIASPEASSAIPCVASRPRAAITLHQPDSAQWR